MAREVERTARGGSIASMTDMGNMGATITTTTHTTQHTIKVGLCQHSVAKTIEPVYNGGKPKATEAGASALATAGKGGTPAAKLEPLGSRASALDTKGKDGTAEEGWQIQGDRSMKENGNMVQLSKIDVKNTFKCLEEHGAEWPTLSTQQRSENKLTEETESGASALDTVRIPGGNLRKTRTTKDTYPKPEANARVESGASALDTTHAG